ncbi:MAG TPA: ROK family protein [Solirubrobacteraceae bacterium]|jgi:glucokinase
MSQHLLAVDIGGTKLAAARFDIDGHGRCDLVAVRRASTPQDAAASRAIITALADEVACGISLDAAGVSFGGPVDAARGVVRLSHHVHGWEDHPLAEEISQRYGVPCALLNDADAGALGEHRWGAGREFSDMLYVTISTGVGAGLILAGQLHRGAHGLSGEMGHLPVSIDGPQCSCGRRGCLEAIASGPAIARAARDARRSAAALTHSEQHTDVDDLDARAVAQAAKQGDEIASMVLAEAGRALGHGLAAAVLLCDPEAIILGGGVVKSGQLFLQPAETVLRARAVGDLPAVFISELAVEAPLYGAAAAASDLLSDPCQRRDQR